MMMNIRLVSFATILQAAVLFLVAVTQVQAGPLSIQRRKTLDVFNPTIIQPTASTTWDSGATELVSWDTRNAPKNISNNGHVVLQRVTTDGTPTKMRHLAGPFNLRDGNVTVTVPEDVVTGQYKIILFGDSGNESEVFHVNGVAPPADGHNPDEPDNSNPFGDDDSGSSSDSNSQTPPAQDPATSSSQ